MEKAIVCGASGFVGSNLVHRLLEEGVQVTAVELPGNPTVGRLPKDKKLRLVFCEPKSALALPQIIGEKEFDVFYNLAWNGAGGPKRADYAIQLDNVKLCLDYLTAADELHCKKFITVGTIGEYMAEMSVQNHIISENFIYATCKSFLHKMLRIAEHKATCRVVWCTLGNLYGPGDPTSNLVNYTAKNLLAGNTPAFGPAKQPFDFVYIGDCVNALYLVGDEDAASSDFYVGSGSPKLLKEFLTEIRDCIDPSLDLGIGKRPDDGTAYNLEWYDCSPLEKETGYKPEYSFAAGVKKTVDWLKQQVDERSL